MLIRARSKTEQSEASYFTFLQHYDPVYAIVFIH